MQQFENPMMRSMAQAVLKKMNEINPTLAGMKQQMKDEAKTWFEKGLLEESKNGCSKDALECYKAAAQNDSEHFPAIFKLASCYEKQGKIS